MKRALDTFEAEREIEEKYRTMNAAPTVAADEASRTRSMLMQYPAAKFARVEYSAAVLEKRFGGDAEIAALAGEIRRQAGYGAFALSVVLQATAAVRGQGQGGVSLEGAMRAASRALTKDLPDFAGLSSISPSLQEELERQESRAPRTAGVGARTTAMPHITCFNCYQRGHFMDQCTAPPRPPGQQQPPTGQSTAGVQQQSRAGQPG
ncbi:MAG: hypothetical protein ACKVQA_26565 [Burkholderiales bacterium]